MKSEVLLWYCSKCKKKLEKKNESYVCEVCSKKIELKDGIWVDTQVVSEKDKEFYDNIYACELGEKWFQGLNRRSVIKKILEKISLSYRRERFFKRNLSGQANIILDLACGAGRDYFKNYGYVVGVDLSYDALQVAKKEYNLVVQGGVSSLPFPDNMFDYVVSSDFFGHVRNEDKDVIMAEINRVLKPGGRTLHIIENDSTNVWFRFAHQYPELFQKYFIEKIGGHVGLELLDTCVKRWEKNKFGIISAEKIWGTIWPIQDYAYLFDNEYKEKNKGIKFIVFISKMLSKIKVVQVGVNIILNPLNTIIEACMPFNNGQGLMLVAEKKRTAVYRFSSDPSGTHKIILDYIKPNTSVLDIGCSTGYLGEFLVTEKKCKVWGIENHELSAIEAEKKGYEQVVRVRIEEVVCANTLEGQKFDHIIIGDVLEHLVDPVQVLKDIKKYLKEQGTIIISLPNVAHYSVRKNLLFGRWDMADTGIMDRTHLHFYTLKTAQEMIEGAGYGIELVRPRGDFERWFRKIGLEALGKKFLFIGKKLFAIQFVFVVKNK